jgi:DNA-binding NtrC family response regulator
MSAQATESLPELTESPDDVDVNMSFKEAKQRWVAAFERRYLAAVYALYGGNVSRAAIHAGINRNHFAKLLDDYRLR